MPSILEINKEKIAVDTTQMSDELKVAYNTFQADFSEEILRSNQSTSGILFQGLEPQWEHAKSQYFPDDLFSYHYIPLSANVSVLPVHKTILEHEWDDSKPLNYGFIARYQDDIEPLNNNTFILVFAPSAEYIESHEKINFEPGIIPEDYSGEMYKYSLHGELRRIHTYNNGHLEDKRAFFSLPEENTNNLRSQVVETCITTVTTTDWFQQGYVGGQPVGEPKHFHTSYDVSVHCSSYVQSEVYWLGDMDYVRGAGGGGAPQSDQPKEEDRKIELRELISDFSHADNVEKDYYDNMITQINFLYKSLKEEHPIIGKIIKMALDKGFKINKLVVDFTRDEDGNPRSTYDQLNKIITIGHEGHFVNAFLEELVHFLQHTVYDENSYSNKYFTDADKKLAIEAEAKLVTFGLKCDLNRMTNPTKEWQLLLLYISPELITTGKSNVLKTFEAEAKKAQKDKDYWLNAPNLLEVLNEIQSEIKSESGYKGEVIETRYYMLIDFIRANRGLMVWDYEK